MPKVSTYKCDMCPQLRLNDTNNWFSGYLIDRNKDGSFAGVMVVPIDVIHVTVIGYGDKKLPDPDAYLCGIDCAQKWILQRLAKLRKPSLSVVKA